MGTFGVGPFDGDGAQDLLDDLAARPAEQRAGVLASLLGIPIADPASVGREVIADEVVAAVALIAAGTSRVPADEPWWRGVSEESARAAPTTDLARLAELAAAALPAVVESWGQGWTSPEDAVAADETVRRLAEVLRAAG